MHCVDQLEVELIMFIFSDKRLTGSFFLKESVRGKSDSQMQGDQYIIGALDINATIRAYQVPISCVKFLRILVPPCIHVYSFYSLKGTWSLDS